MSLQISIILAIQQQRPDELARLLAVAKPADYKDINPQTDRTPLEHAAAMGNLAAVHLILSKPGFTEEEHKAAFTLALQGRHIGVTSFLMQRETQPALRLAWRAQASTHFLEGAEQDNASYEAVTRETESPAWQGPLVVITSSPSLASLPEPPVVPVVVTRFKNPFQKTPNPYLNQSQIGLSNQMMTARELKIFLNLFIEAKQENAAPVELDLSDNPLLKNSVRFTKLFGKQEDYAAFAALCQVVAAGHIKTLKLSSCGLDEKAMELLTAAITASSRLECLDVSKNPAIAPRNVGVFLRACESIDKRITLIAEASGLPERSELALAKWNKDIIQRIAIEKMRTLIGETLTAIEEANMILRNPRNPLPIKAQANDLKNNALNAVRAGLSLNALTIDQGIPFSVAEQAMKAFLESIERIAIRDGEEESIEKRTVKMLLKGFLVAKQATEASETGLEAAYQNGDVALFQALMVNHLAVLARHRIPASQSRLLQQIVLDFDTRPEAATALMLAPIHLQAPSPEEIMTQALTLCERLLYQNEGQLRVLTPEQSAQQEIVLNRVIHRLVENRWGVLYLKQLGILPPDILTALYQKMTDSMEAQLFYHKVRGAIEAHKRHQIGRDFTKGLKLLGEIAHAGKFVVEGATAEDIACLSLGLAHTGTNVAMFVINPVVAGVALGVFLVVAGIKIANHLRKDTNHPTVKDPLKLDSERIKLFTRSFLARYQEVLLTVSAKEREAMAARFMYCLSRVYMTPIENFMDTLQKLYPDYKPGETLLDEEILADMMIHVTVCYATDHRKKSYKHFRSESLSLPDLLLMQTVTRLPEDKVAEGVGLWVRPANAVKCFKKSNVQPFKIETHGYQTARSIPSPTLYPPVPTITEQAVVRAQPQKSRQPYQGGLRHLGLSMPEILAGDTAETALTVTTRGFFLSSNHVQQLMSQVVELQQTVAVVNARVRTLEIEVATLRAEREERPHL